MRVCPTCASENQPDAMFCDACGEFLDWDSQTGPVVADRPGGSRFQASPASAASPPASSGAAPPVASDATAAPPAPPTEPAPEVAPVDPDATAAPPAPPTDPAPEVAPVVETPEVQPHVDEAPVVEAPAAAPHAEPPTPPPPAAPVAEERGDERARRLVARSAPAPAPGTPNAASPPTPVDTSPAAIDSRRDRAPERAPASGGDAAADPAGGDTTPPPRDPAQDERVRRLVARSSVLPAAPPEQPAPTEPTPAHGFGAPLATPAEQAPPAEPPVRRLGTPVAAPPDRPAPTEPTPAHGFATPVAPDAAPPPAALASIISVAERSGRTDLSTRLKESRDDLRRTGVGVAIVGEYKRGKSTLLNALVNAEVCPADPVYASVVPVAVEHGDDYTVTITYADGRTESETLESEQLVEIASEVGNDCNRLGLLRVDATVPRRLLAAGLRLIDMPGVGGLDSAVGALNLASLDSADGVLFVTDCTQELTASELSFLSAARSRCPATICVMTKLDMQHHARSLVARNREHLDRAGLGDVPVYAVSSVLHLVALAEGDPQLERESGFAELFDALHQQIWEPARRRGLAEAGRQLADLADHLSLPIEAEQAALRSPEDAERTLGRLTEFEDRVRRLQSAAARWQQRLAEGAQDTAADLDHELRDRLRSVARMADGRAEVAASIDDLVFEAWLHKTATDQVVAHYERIGERMAALSDEVAEHFLALDRHAALQVVSEAPADKLSGVSVTRESEVLKDGVFRRLATTGQGWSSGIVVTSSVLGVFGGAFLLVPALVVPVAGLMARRAFVDDRDRRRAARRLEMKRMANRYLDEVGFIVHKDSRDAIRRVHRQIREHYMERTRQLEETLLQARMAAENARERNGSGADESSQPSIDETVDVLRQVKAAANRLVAAAPGGAQGT